MSEFEVVWNEQLQRAAAASERRRYHQRSLLHDQLVGEEFAGLRAWLREQAALLEVRAAAALCRRLWDERQHWSAVYELAAGAALRRAGLRPVYEQRWDRPGGGVQTPDWSVYDQAGRLVALVEVHTDQPAPDVDGQIRDWRAFGDRLGEIARPVIFYLDAPSPRRPPTGKVAKQLVAGLRANLRQVELTGGFTGHGYHLRILADRTGRPVQAPVGLRAQLAWPTPTAGRVDADRLTRKIAGKASKYRALAAELGVPFVVAVGAEPFTGVTLADFDNLLTGSSTLVLQFNPQDLALGLDSGEVSMHREAWLMPTALAGVLWLDRDLPFTATIRPNPAADLPLTGPMGDIPDGTTADPLPPDPLPPEPMSPDRPT